MRDVTRDSDLPDIDAVLSAFRNGADEALFNLLKGEAIFGWGEIGGEIDGDCHCLEIGAGPGLLAMLAARRARTVDALEPSTDAFASFAPVLAAVERDAPGNLRFIRTTIEDFKPDRKYDVIWSVNVFEHLDDWRACLLKVRELLRPGGRAIILCPNYGIPYEPHFSLPIIFTKDVTRRLFSSRIARFEEEQNCAGLWESINMISLRDVMRYAREADLDVSLDSGVMRRMFERFFSDAELSRRHGLIRTAIGVARRTGVDRAISAMPPLFHPYVSYRLTA